MSTSTLHRSGLLLLCLSGLALTGCQQAQLQRNALAPHGRAIVMDGFFNDWPQNTASLSDDQFLYFRVSVEGHGMPLQAAPETVALWLDIDNNPATGIRPRGLTDQTPELGADLIIEFSPQGQRAGQLRPGVAVFAVDNDGARIPLSHAQIDLISAPTHAAGAYEIRISRHILGEAPEYLRSALASRGQARTMFMVSGPEGDIRGWSDPELFERRAASSQPARTDIAIPAPPEGAVRVLSWNVKDNQPLNTPAPFARVIQALNPDVILLQEMWDTNAATIQAWFTSVITGDVDWQVRTATEGAGGIAIISRHPVSPLGPDRLVLPQDAGQQAGRSRGSERTVRFIGANVDTPQGVLAVANIHLKCCGTADSSEDQRRIAEARMINAELRQALDGSAAPMRMIAGDFNLVGTREPLDILRDNLDVDGSGLHPAGTMVLGDAATYTWFDPDSQFSASRLDWAVVGNTGAQVVQSFILDGRRLREASLTRSGLDRRDTLVSDHFPMVIDIRPR